jgi:hypothetical protein
VFSKLVWKHRLLTLLLQVEGMKVDAILRGGIRKFTDEVGVQEHQAWWECGHHTVVVYEHQVCH